MQLSFKVGCFFSCVAGTLKSFPGNIFPGVSFRLLFTHVFLNSSVSRHGWMADFGISRGHKSGCGSQTDRWLILLPNIWEAIGKSGWPLGFNSSHRWFQPSTMAGIKLKQLYGKYPWVSFPLFVEVGVVKHDWAFHFLLYNCGYVFFLCLDYCDCLTM